jgi:hypothetical protein
MKDNFEKFLERRKNRLISQETEDKTKNQICGECQKTVCASQRLGNPI